MGAAWNSCHRRRPRRRAAAVRERLGGVLPPAPPARPRRAVAGPCWGSWGAASRRPANRWWSTPGPPAPAPRAHGYSQVCHWCREERLEFTGLMARRLPRTLRCEGRGARAGGKCVSAGWKAGAQRGPHKKRPLQCGRGGGDGGDEPLTRAHTSMGNGNVMGRTRVKSNMHTQQTVIQKVKSTVSQSHHITWMAFFIWACRMGLSSWHARSLRGRRAGGGDGRRLVSCCRSPAWARIALQAQGRCAGSAPEDLLDAVHRLLHLRRRRRAQVALERRRRGGAVRGALARPTAAAACRIGPLALSDGARAPTFWYRSLYASAWGLPLFQFICVATMLRSLRHTNLRGGAQQQQQERSSAVESGGAAALSWQKFGFCVGVRAGAARRPRAARGPAPGAEPRARRLARTRACAGRPTT
jgi:hypothetical protein